MAILLRDDFAGTEDATVQSRANTWAGGAGVNSWTRINAVDSYISSASRMYGGIGNGSLYGNTTALGTANYTVTATLRRVSTTNVGFELRFRQSADGNTTYRLSYNNTAGQWELRRIVAGAYELVNGNPAPYVDAFAAGEDRVVVITADGSSLTVTIDGVERFSATDTAVAAGGVGWDSGTGPASGVHLDQIEVTSIGGGVTGTEVRISTLPFSIEEGAAFTISGQLTDASGNVDTSLTGNVTISTNLGTLGGTTTVAAVAGAFSFTGLTLDTDGAATLTASYAGLTPDTLAVTVTNPGATPPETTYAYFEPKNAANIALTGKTIAVVSSNVAVATVATPATEYAAGLYRSLVSAVGVGTCNITGSCEGIEDFEALTVQV